MEGAGITNLSGIEAFENLEVLRISSNTNLDNLPISQNSNLREVYAPYTDISSVDLSANEKLKKIDFQSCLFLESITYPTSNSRLENISISNTKIANLPVSGLTALKYVFARQTKLTTIDLSQNEQLEQLFANDNALLTNVKIKNGFLQNISDLDVRNCPNLTTICVNSVSEANAKDTERWKKDATANYTETCN